jgi:hypothetical protein
MRVNSLVVLGILLAGSVCAQNVERRIRASVSGQNGDSGKCTIEVDVDDVAVVEIFQDQGRLITLSGQPAEWRRMQCNQPLPANPAEFHFQGVDGRGRVSLVREPRDNRGTAVVRIEDSKGGREAYTFDLTWRSGYGNQQGIPQGNPQYGTQQNPGPGNGVYRDGGRPRRWETDVISCNSDGRRRSYCDADTSRGVLLLRPRGDADCRLNVNWGFDQRGIWVEQGCRADFQVGRREN